MASSRYPIRDPRTIARDIPGLLDCVFPQIGAGLATFFNKKAMSFSGVDQLSDAELAMSSMRHALLFEISVIRAESLLRGMEPDWNTCLEKAISRQRRHFDFQAPTEINFADKFLATRAADNLCQMINQILFVHSHLSLTINPAIPGLGWIASGEGDFAIGNILLEVKHTAANFSSSDFRQVLMYWLLVYAKSLQDG